MEPILLGGKVLPVFPCLANKKPATPHGFKDATADPAAIGELWRSHWGPLVGLPTGERSGLDVLDIDLDGLSWFDRYSGRMPLTRMHETRSGGRHLFFRHQPGLRCSTSKIELGVDVRADGGYVIWWPATGGRVICEGPIANLPQWVLEVLTIPGPAQGEAGCELSGLNLLPRPNREHPLLCPTRNLTRRTQRILLVVEKAPVGVRNARLYWAACRFSEIVAEGVLSREVAKQALLSAAQLCGLTRDDGIAATEKTIASGLSTSRAVR
jgi:hypothetical protein